MSVIRLTIDHHSSDPEAALALSRAVTGQEGDVIFHAERALEAALNKHTDSVMTISVELETGPALDDLVEDHRGRTGGGR